MDPAAPDALSIPFDRAAREDAEDALLAPGATRAAGAGDRAHREEPDPWRTCFEKDRDRILHSTSFRRLSGKTQVFVFPEDHQRTRLTHALEVAQVATAIARACRLNVALTEAIALGHDCGHGPGGHASEDALDPFLPGGFDHAPWGAHVSLSSLNLCTQTLDGIANHSWSRPAPSTPEGEVVSWADRVAYVCHDWEDAVPTGIVAPHQLPLTVRDLCGDTPQRAARHLHSGSGRRPPCARARWAWRRSWPTRSPPSAPATTSASTCGTHRCAQGEAVISVLRALVEHFSDRPHLIAEHRARHPVRHRGREPGGHRGRRYLRGRHDRPLRLPSGHCPARMGPGQAALRHRRLIQLV